MYIITGGAGFIGSNIVKLLNKKGKKDIIIVDSLKNSDKFKNLIELEFIDLIDKDYFINNIDNFKSKDLKMIIHQGACTNTMEHDGKFMLENNYEYSKKLLYFAIKENINFLYASSAAVYGNTNCFKEDKKECLKPLNIYGFSKLLFDNFVRKYINEVKIQITGLRYFNVYGQGEYHKDKMSSVILQFYKQLKKEKKIKLFKGSENFKRDFIYINDLLKIINFFIDNKKSGIFNAGTGENNSFYDIANIFKQRFNNIKIKEIDFPEKLKNKYQYNTKADLKKLKQIYPNLQFSNFKDNINKYIDILVNSNYFL